MSRSVKENIRRRVIARDGRVCQICREAIPEGHEVTIDHVVPRAKGGLSVLENLRVACKPCNGARGDGRHTADEEAKIRAKIWRKLKLGPAEPKRQPAVSPLTTASGEVIRPLNIPFFYPDVAAQKREEA